MVAFVFTFSIIITSVGVVSAVGFSVLEDVQADEQALNAQRGFQSLGQNLNEVDRSHVPGRSGEISLSEGALYVDSGGDGPTFEVTVDGGPTYTTEVGTIVYESQKDGTRIALEAGGVVREDEFAERGVVVQSPNVVCGSDYAIVSVLEVVSDENVRGGEGTIQIVGRERSSSLLYSNTAGGVTVNYADSEFNEAWAGHFDGSGEWTNVDGTDAKCDFGGPSSDGQVIVRRTVIEIQFVG